MGQRAVANGSPVGWLALAAGKRLFLRADSTLHMGR